MKFIINKQITILFSIIFVFCNALSCRHKSHYDGTDTLGFPLIYYKFFGGKCENCYGDNGFNIIFFLIDVIVTWLVSIGIWYIIKVYRK